MDLPGPDKWLNAIEAARTMGVPERVFVRLVRTGVIPPPTAMTKKTKLWPALTIFCCSHLLPHLLRIAKVDLDEEGHA